MFGRLAGIAPGIGWSAASSVSLLTGAGLVVCGATLLVQRARTSDGDDATSRATLLPALFVLFEVMVLKLKEMLGVTPESMRARHTNME